MRISPEQFDVVVVGTGLQESFIASSASLIGKSVLHIDSESVYGDLWGGLRLDEFIDCLQRRSQISSTNEQQQQQQQKGIFQNVDIQQKDLEELRNSRDYTIDLAPKLTYSCGRLLALLVQSECHHYVDYRHLDTCLAWQNDNLIHVPSSRSDIFKDRTLSATEKRTLTAFLKSAVELFENNAYLALDFDTWLSEYDLTQRIVEMIRKAVCFDEENVDSLSRFEALGMYLLSSGKFKLCSGPFISPFYSASDVPQAFCRLCAVHGGTYVLNCSLKCVSMEPNDYHLITEYDQKIKFQKICIPGYLLQTKDLLLTPNLSFQKDMYVERKISRGLCIINKSLLDDASQIFIVAPKGSKPSIHFMQIGPPACPPDRIRFLFYSFCWSQASTSKEDLSETLHEVFESRKGASQFQILMECYYNQLFLQTGDSDLPDICLSDTPGGFVDYLQDIRAGEKKFHALFPGAEFCKPILQPRHQTSQEDSDEDLFEELETELSTLGNH